MPWETLHKDLQLEQSSPTLKMRIIHLKWNFSQKQKSIRTALLWEIKIQGLWTYGKNTSNINMVRIFFKVD